MANLPKIDRYFASDRLEDILDALDAGAARRRRVGGDAKRRRIRSKSPMACKVSLKLLVRKAPTSCTSSTRCGWNMASWSA